MATPRFGSARIDENNKISGGKAGNQSGKELDIQSYYVHSKGWRVLRVKDPAKADAVAACMEAACANKLIGYDQSQRNTLYNAAKAVGFDVRLVKTAVETDCSALVRVCLAFAGVFVADFNTSNEASVLLKSGEVEELTDTKYTKQSDYLRRGDILVTKTKGHTGVILDDGPKAGSAPITTVYKLGDRILKSGMEGTDVKELQRLLIQLGYSCGSCGADGEFGGATELAVRKFQQDHACGVDGEAGPETISALAKARGGEGARVRIAGGQCWVRATPDTSGAKLGVAREGLILPYGGQRSADGWLLVEWGGGSGWVSGRYGRLVE